MPILYSLCIVLTPHHPSCHVIPHVVIMRSRRCACAPVGVESVKCDLHGRMNLEALEQAVVDAKGAGRTPFYVAATAGTTVRQATVTSTPGRLQAQHPPHLTPPPTGVHIPPHPTSLLCMWEGVGIIEPSVLHAATWPNPCLRPSVTPQQPHFFFGCYHATPVAWGSQEMEKPNDSSSVQCRLNFAFIST